MIDAALQEGMAHAQPGMARANDDDVDVEIDAGTTDSRKHRARSWLPESNLESTPQSRNR